MTLTKQPSRLIIPEVERVRQRLERWRRTRKKRSRIPEPLWHAAVEIAGSFGLNKTAKALRLDYYELKKRLESSAGAVPVGKEAIPSFVEVVRTASSVLPECLVELESASGTKMRIHLKGAPDVAFFRSLFWGAAS